jgi:antitoxin (DNA-binding transcriptional repressor) of toxin-antitoxin stability system
MHLSRLIERVEQGECITIARNNRPVALVLATNDERLRGAAEKVGAALFAEPSASS